MNAEKSLYTPYTNLKDANETGLSEIQFNYGN